MNGCNCTAELRELELATENVELRHQLAEVQEQCVELAVDAGELHAEIQALRAQLRDATDQRDAWRSEVEGFLSPRRSAVR